MERAAALAKYQRLHEDRPYHDGTFTRWAEKRSDRFPYHHSDGVTVWVADQDYAPDDLAFTAEVAPRTPPSPA
ncbi:hypothetical protein [Nocardioides sp. Leaf374]|uniref:hypothetical protein n=1 Tax=Nocardioides sp. Leaf374 TaxID=2876560 RepID=UPI001E60F6D3|nr:hypothetical protein [Nocardioides sp. Leaf374]